MFSDILLKIEVPLQYLPFDTNVPKYIHLIHMVQLRKWKSTAQITTISNLFAS